MWKKSRKGCINRIEISTDRYRKLKEILGLKIIITEMEINH